MAVTVEGMNALAEAQGSICKSTHGAALTVHLMNGHSGQTGVCTDHCNYGAEGESSFLCRFICHINKGISRTYRGWWQRRSLRRLMNYDNVAPEGESLLRYLLGCADAEFGDMMEEDGPRPSHCWQLLHSCILLLRCQLYIFYLRITWRSGGHRLSCFLRVTFHHLKTDKWFEHKRQISWQDRIHHIGHIATAQTSTPPSDTSHLPQTVLPTPTHCGWCQHTLVVLLP